MNRGFKEKVLERLRLMVYRSRMKNGSCGCGGQLNNQGFCMKFFNSPTFDNEVAGESLRAHGGLGFGSAVGLSPSEAIMSMHRQVFGAKPGCIKPRSLR